MSDVRFLWDLYWPILAVAVLVGIVGGVVAFRWRKRARTLGIAAMAAAVVGVMALWHGPGGAAERFRASVEQVAETTLGYYEMTQVDARLESGPLTRTLVLSGPADAFQRGELARILGDVPGVGGVRWADAPDRGLDLPLLVIAELLALAGFAVGLLVAYLYELRRRARAEWRW